MLQVGQRQIVRAQNESGRNVLHIDRVRVEWHHQYWRWSNVVLARMWFTIFIYFLFKFIVESTSFL